MKCWITTIAITAITFLGTTIDADAHSYRSRVYISGYRPCGTPIYKQRYVIRYDHCGHPVWGCRVVAAPRAHCPPPPPRCYPVAPVCPPPRSYCGEYPRSGVVIHGTVRL